MSNTCLFNSNYFKDKVVLITGASGGGIGTNVAKNILDLKGTVILNGKNDASLKRISNQLNSDYYSANITNLYEVEKMFDYIVSKYGRIDILINNAAYGGSNSKLFDIDNFELEKEISVNFKGALYCSKFASESMVKQKYGKIIFISSSAAYRGTHGRNVGYASSKAALHGLTKQLALELGPYNINVNAICPSQIDTPRIRKNGRKNDDSLNKHAENLPLGRIGSPQDVSNLLIFLASDAASYVTGEIIVIDGGSSLASITTNIIKA